MARSGAVVAPGARSPPTPARIYANEGIAQMVFFESSEPCLKTYKQRAGKYQGQRGITLPKA